MKKSVLLSLLSIFLLTGCEFTSTTPSDETDYKGSEETFEHESHQDEGNKEEQEEEHHEEHEEEHHDDPPVGGRDFSLSDYTNFSWHNGHKPQHNEYWDYYIKDTYNPAGALWENPNEAVDYSGVEFKDHNSYIISPTFNSWKKVELRLTLWCSALTASKYQATENKAQFVIEEYNENDTLLGSESLSVERSDVPKNNTPLNRTVYLKDTNMSYFIIRHNNWVPNGQSSYALILCDATLKGWDYE